MKESLLAAPMLRCLRQAAGVPGFKVTGAFQVELQFLPSLLLGACIAYRHVMQRGGTLDTRSDAGYTLEVTFEFPAYLCPLRHNFTSWVIL